MMRKKKAEEEMKKKVEEEERKRKQRERVKENRKWAESQDLTPYLERLQREKEGVSVHVSEEDRSSDEVNTEKVIESSEPITKEGENSRAATTLPKTGVGLNEGTMMKNNIEDNRVEQSVEAVENTITKEGEPEVESGLEVVETTKEVAERQVAEVGLQNNVENNDTARLERVELATSGQGIETPDRREINTANKQLDKDVDNEQSGDNVVRDPVVASSSNNVETTTEGEKEVESEVVEEKLEGWAGKLRDLLNAQRC